MINKWTWAATILVLLLIVTIVLVIYINNNEEPEQIPSESKSLQLREFCEDTLHWYSWVTGPENLRGRWLASRCHCNKTEIQEIIIPNNYEITLGGKVIMPMYSQDVYYDAEGYQEAGLMNDEILLNDLGYPNIRIEVLQVTSNCFKKGSDGNFRESECIEDDALIIDTNGYVDKTSFRNTKEYPIEVKFNAYVKINNCVEVK